LVADLAEWMHTRVPGRIELRMPGRDPIGFGLGAGTTIVISGKVQQLAGWLTGRSGGEDLIAPGGLPELPSWL
ncbi:MAG TPA: hypothetical protein VFO16_21410, partial [Pseudonocardiaceae bacterium]|nr:hypothetical protein [Pseudonocardiaceae bacterium]